MMNLKKTFFALITFFAVTLPAYQVFGQTTQIDWPNSPMGTKLGLATEFHEFIAYIYEWGISLGGIFVFAMLVTAGIQYLTSAGDPGKMSAAMGRIRSAITGLILLLTSWLVLNTINPQLVRLEPLPRLWDQEMIVNGGMNVFDSMPVPCDYVIIWAEENYSGGNSSPIKFDDPIKIDFDSDGNIEVIRTIGLIRLEGSNAVNQRFNDNWASGKGFVRMTTDEIKDVELEIIDIERYDENGMVNNVDGQYKEGGLCMMDMFYTTRKWFSTNSCGGRMARIQFPSPDFSINKFRDEALTCVELTRTLQ